MRTMLLIGLLLSTHAGANETFVYPSQGQSAEQQRQDEFECHQWAVEQSGFDPLAHDSPSDKAGSAVDAAASADKEPAGKSALRGAAKGAVVAEVSDGDAAKGAATGAVLGAIGSARRNKRAQQAAAQDQRSEEAREQAERAAMLKQKRQDYSRASAACLEGRGYTVK